MEKVDNISEEIAILLRAFNDSIKSIALLDYETRFLYVNDIFQHRCGYGKEELLGNKVSLLKSGQHDTEFYKQLWDRVNTNQMYQAVFTNKNKAGTFYHDEQTIIPIGEAGKEQHFLVVGKDISNAIASELNSMSYESIE